MIDLSIGNLEVGGELYEKNLAKEGLSILEYIRLG